MGPADDTRVISRYERATDSLECFAIFPLAPSFINSTLITPSMIQEVILDDSSSLHPLFVCELERKDKPGHECTELCDRVGLRNQFAALEDGWHRWRDVVFHRRSGAECTIWSDAIRVALNEEQSRFAHRTNSNITEVSPPFMLSKT